ncbi:MAG TPA: hypothetical protein VJQ82_06310 [Terriglobales bacterium]|nr:hypothetical protein [Terriglobales bacterium]
MRLLAILTLLSAFAPSVFAQRMGHVVPPHSGRFISHLQVQSPYHHDRGFPGNFYSPYGYGFFPPDLYADDVAAPSQPTQPVIVMQAPPAAAPAAEAPAPAPQPLMIELQGDRYVQVSGSEDSSAQRIDQPVARVSAKSTAQQRPQQNPPVLLVFRDGHSEEISSYTIENGILYSAADYYTAGSWNRKIELSLLNLPATVNSNRSRGVAFMLPTAPNEVVVGP